MNRAAKEEARKRREAREGKTQAEIEALDREDELLERIDRLHRELHAEWFPEEYDFLYDDALDRADRAAGINPMKQECFEEIQERRRRQGVTPLSKTGVAVSSDSWLMARKEAERRLRGEGGK